MIDDTTTEPGELHTQLMEIQSEDDDLRNAALALCVIVKEQRRQLKTMRAKIEELESRMETRSLPVIVKTSHGQYLSLHALEMARVLPSGDVEFHYRDMTVSVWGGDRERMKMLLDRVSMYDLTQ